MDRPYGKTIGNPLLLILLVVLVSQALLAGCGGDAGSTTVTTADNPAYPSTTSIITPSTSAYEDPPPATLFQNVMDVDPLKMWDEYQADPVAAAAKYEGQTFHFPNVVVDNMSYLGEGMDLEFYVQSGGVKFRTDQAVNIVMVKTGYTVDIIGTVTGLKWNALNVWISTIMVTDPPGGGTWSEY